MAVPLVLIAEFLFRIFHLHKTCLLTKKNGPLWNGDWMHKLEYVLDEVTYVKIGDRMLLFFRFMHESVSWIGRLLFFVRFWVYDMAWQTIWHTHMGNLPS